MRRAEPLDGKTGQRFANLARDLAIHLLVGSFNERSDDAARCYNTSVLFSPEGKILATYRKVHMFDIDLPDLKFMESATCLPGAGPVVVATPFGKLGLSICFDLRFPEHYRELVDQGAEILLIPSALHPPHRQGPLGDPAARPGDREPVLPRGARPGRQARRRRPQGELGTFDDHRPLGRRAGRSAGRPRASSPPGSTSEERVAEVLPPPAAAPRGPRERPGRGERLRPIKPPLQKPGGRATSRPPATVGAERSRRLPGEKRTRTLLFRDRSPAGPQRSRPAGASGGLRI